MYQIAPRDTMRGLRRVKSGMRVQVPEEETGPRQPLYGGAFYNHIRQSSSAGGSVQQLPTAVPGLARSQYDPVPLPPPPFGTL